MNTIIPDQVILNEIESRKLLEQYNIPVNRYVFINKKEKALKEAKKMCFPLVMKVISSSIVHKSDFGGVQIGLNDLEDVSSAFDQIYRNALGKGVSENKIEGVVLQEMIEDTQEILVGIKRDPIFGAVLVIGLGGIFVELLKDVSLGICPLSEKEIFEMIKKLKGYPLLNGFRGKPLANVSALVSLSKKVADMAIQNEQIVEMDLNPVMVGKKEDGIAIAVDARIVLQK